REGGALAPGPAGGPRGPRPRLPLAPPRTDPPYLARFWRGIGPACAIHWRPMTEPAVNLRDERRWPVLGIAGFSHPDLHDALRLRDLTAAFDRDFQAADPEIFARFEQHRRTPLTGPAEGDLLVAVAGHVSRFVGKLFGVSGEQASQRAAAGRDAPI